MLALALLVVVDAFKAFAFICKALFIASEFSELTLNGNGSPNANEANIGLRRPGKKGREERVGD